MWNIWSSTPAKALLSLLSSRKSPETGRQIYTLPPERALQPGTQQSNGRGQERQVRSRVMRQRRGKKGRIKGEMKYCRHCERGKKLRYRWNATWLLFACCPRLCSHTLFVLYLSLSIYPPHTHTHAQREAINLPLSAAGIETPKTGQCCVWRECRCTCLQHIILSVPLPLPHRPPPSFYPLDLSPEFSVSCS